MDSREKPQKEREDTDASLRAERSKTDSELAKTRTAVEGDADHVVEVARERAEATLHDARDRADRGMAAAGASLKVLEELAVERAAEDEAVLDERVIADERLRIEREERQRALSALLHLEREATDDGLVIERAHADTTVATRDDFLGMVSHDLRNMLGNVAMSASLLARRAREEGPGSAAVLAHAERIQRSTARMNHLVGDLLDVVSLEAGMLHVTLRQSDALLLAKEAMDAFQPSFAAKGIVMTTETTARSLVLKFDHDRILQVLANVLSNALKFTPRGGRVTLEITSSGSGVTFGVTDTGVGIPPGESEAVFERFKQVTKDQRGLGLGLYISKCIVEAHAGRIWAERPAAGGTAIRFTLPSAT